MEEGGELQKKFSRRQFFQALGVITGGLIIAACGSADSSSGSEENPRIQSAQETQTARKADPLAADRELQTAREILGDDLWHRIVKVKVITPDVKTGGLVETIGGGGIFHSDGQVMILAVARHLFPDTQALSAGVKLYQPHIQPIDYGFYGQGFDGLSGEYSLVADPGGQSDLSFLVIKAVGNWVGREVTYPAVVTQPDPGESFYTLDWQKSAGIKGFLCQGTVSLNQQESEEYPKDAVVNCDVTNPGSSGALWMSPRGIIGVTYGKSKYSSSTLITKFRGWEGLDVQLRDAVEQIRSR